MRWQLQEYVIFILLITHLGRWSLISYQKDIQDGAPHELVSDPSSQQVTSSEAFTTGAGNHDNGNIYDGTGNAGTDQYSKLPSLSCLSSSIDNFQHRLLLRWLGKLSSFIAMGRV